MNSDQLVSARDVLKSIAEVRRLGVERMLADWEQREPDLTEYLLEGVSELHRLLIDTAPHPKTERRLIRRTESLILVLLTALRRALLRQWLEEEAPMGNAVPPTPDPSPDTAEPDPKKGGDPDGP
jgi:hypothetical protein